MTAVIVDRASASRPEKCFSLWLIYSFLSSSSTSRSHPEFRVHLRPTSPLDCVGFGFGPGWGWVCVCNSKCEATRDLSHTHIMFNFCWVLLVCWVKKRLSLWPVSVSCVPAALSAASSTWRRRQRKTAGGGMCMRRGISERVYYRDGEAGSSCSSE